MRYMAVLLLVIILGGGLYVADTATESGKDQGNTQNAQARSQQDLQKAIQMIFLQHGEEGKGDNDKKEKIKQLGPREEVIAILREMAAWHKYAREESLELTYLYGAVWMLGEMADKQAEDRLSKMAFNPRVHENIRALAVRSLGNIDASSNQKLLLQALRRDKSDNFMVRVYAAEGLAKIKDTQVLAALELAVRQESDSFVREKFRAAAREVRSKL
jgi:HEAT repeat protein